MINTFKRGVHPNGKKVTADCPLKDFPVPDVVCIPLSQHIGAPAEAVVNIGDYVKVGTLIGKSTGFVSANVFSSVSGTVKEFLTLPTAPGGACKHIAIENDGKYDAEFLEILNDPTSEEIVHRVQEAGIVGMGGATFPTHVKLSPKNHVDTLIINAAECEPYITCDNRLLLEKTEDFFQGVLLLKKALNAENAFVGIEKNKPEAIAKLQKECPAGVVIVPCKVKYPQGAEKQLIYAVTKRKVPCGGLPADVGVCVSNVHTAYSVCRAVKYGEPCFMRAMTVSGDGIKDKGNFWVRNGTSYQFIHDILDDANEPDKNVKIISGGPMMGFAQPSMKVCTSKGSSSLLFLTEDEVNMKPTTPCINCAGCAHVCPMHLMPMKIEAAVLHGDWEDAKKWGVLNCIECGCCAFNCPAKRPLTQAIRLAKKTIKEKKI